VSTFGGLFLHIKKILKKYFAIWKINLSLVIVKPNQTKMKQSTKDYITVAIIIIIALLADSLINF